MVVDDLWLYQYHQKEYEGIIRQVFATIAFVEEKQWEVVGLSQYLDEMKAKIPDIPRYNPHSNEKYMRESRNNNLLLDNLLDFLVFSVPLMVLLEFLYYKVFYCLFDYEISKYLRPYSFRLILIEILIQGNLEVFTFLGCRALQIFFSYTLVSTIMEIFTVAFVLVVVLVGICSYWGYYYQYGKFARYFLANMYRFKSSYVLMTILFGVRPFLKGIVHAFFFEQWTLQIWLLIGIEALMIFITILFEIVLDNHKHRIILFFELLYSFCLIGLNILLLCQHEFFVGDEQMQIELEVYMKLLVYFMIILWALRFVAEIKVAIECKCGSTVVPQGQVEG